MSSSTTSPAAEETSAAPTNGTSNNPNFGASALNGSPSLYLYTFLATLVLLLIVSVFVVFRTYLLRRRYQALVAEAIRNGTYVPGMFPPPPTGYGVRNAFTSGWNRPVVKEAEQPKMFDVYLRGGDEQSIEKEEKELWEGITPISVFSCIASPLQFSPLPPPTSFAGTWTSESRVQAHEWIPSWFRHPHVPLHGFGMGRTTFLGNQIIQGQSRPGPTTNRDDAIATTTMTSVSTTTSSAPPTSSATSPQKDIDPDALNVVYLVRMPSPSLPSGSHPSTLLERQAAKRVSTTTTSEDAKNSSPIPIMEFGVLVVKAPGL